MTSFLVFYDFCFSHKTFPRARVFSDKQAMKLKNAIDTNKSSLGTIYSIRR